MAFKKIELGSQTPPLPQTPYIAYGIGQKLNLKGTPMIFIGKFEEFYVPHSSDCDKITTFEKKKPKVIWDLKCDHGVCTSRPILV